MQARWDLMVQEAGATVDSACFPLTARERMLEEAEESGACVVAGFFYRDNNGDGKYQQGEELPATLLGAPRLEHGESPAKMYFNCYWINSPKSGNATLAYAPDGVAPFRKTISLRPGLNICHIPIEPVKPLIYLLVHSHFDTEWVWTYEECLKRVEIPNMLQRLDIIQKDPAHCFSNDEECVTKPLVERSDPSIREILRKGILEGTIEAKGLVTQQELTMPYGESIIRGMIEGERMLLDIFGEEIKPDVYWSIDQYGVGYQMPQILAKAGRKYFLMGDYVLAPSQPESKQHIPHSDPELYECPEFWMQGIDGSRMLVHRSSYWSANGMLPSRMPPRAPYHSGLSFLGADNCPPVADLAEQVSAENAKDGEYKFIISPSDPFFRTVEQCAELPTFTSESYVSYWSGIYESRARSRQQNRELENSVLSTEALAVCAGTDGMEFPRGLDEGWYLLMLNQHHDPLMSPMATPGLFDKAVPARYERAKAIIQGALQSTLHWLCTDISTDEKTGSPSVVFNPLARRRSDVFEIDVQNTWDSYAVTDCGGKTYPCQVVAQEDRRTKLVVFDNQLPALGWRTYYAARSDSAGAGALGGGVSVCDTTMENEHLRVELDSGKITRIIEKASGTVVLEAGGKSAINEVLIWKDTGCISVIRPTDENDVVSFIDNPDAEVICRSSDVESLEITIVENGPVRGVVRTRFDLDWGSFQQDLCLEAGSRALRFSTTVFWDPADKIAPYNGRRVRVAFPTSYKGGQFVSDIPFAAVDRPQSEKIRPVNSWAALEGDDTGVALCHRGTPSVQAVDDVLYMTLFRSVVEPEYQKDDPARCGWDHRDDDADEDGWNRFEYDLLVYSGGWKKAQVAGTNAELNTPIYSVSANRYGGVDSPFLPGEKSFIEVLPASLVVSAVKPQAAAGGGLIVRIYNPGSETVSGTVHIGIPHRLVEEVNFREESLGELARENPYDLSFAPYEIKTVRIALK